MALEIHAGVICRAIERKRQLIEQSQVFGDEERWEYSTRLPIIFRKPRSRYQSPAVSRRKEAPASISSITAKEVQGSSVAVLTVTVLLVGAWRRLPGLQKWRQRYRRRGFGIAAWPGPARQGQAGRRPGCLGRRCLDGAGGPGARPHASGPTARSASRRKISRRCRAQDTAVKPTKHDNRPGNQKTRRRRSHLRRRLP